MTTQEDDAARAVAPSTVRSLPAWFVGNRVQGHTRLRLNRLDTREFTRAAAGFGALGAGAFTRHVKTGEEDPWWPSAEPPGGDGGRDVASEIVAEAHAEGLRIITYYWHMSEARFAGPDSEWVCEEPDGTPIESPRGLHVDITGPYRDVVLTRLLELAERGADGFYFDFRHLPPRGCWGSALEDAWTAETGEPAPPRDEKNPLYLQFLDFGARTIEDTFAYWRDGVRAEHPAVVFVISTTTVPALTVREMTTRLARIADSAKNEYEHALDDDFNRGVFVRNPDLAVPEAHVRQALGWTVLRDSSDGRPPHIWAPGLPNDDHAQGFAAALLTFGCIAAMDVDEDILLRNEDPRAGKTPRSALRLAFALGKAVSPHLAGTQPLRWAAVHFGERSRNDRQANYRAAWQEVLWPLVGAYQVLSEDRLPVGVVNDHQLERGELDGYRLLVLPNADELTAAQQRSVDAFRARGGAVVENDPEWAWSDLQEGGAAAAAFRAAVRPHVAGAPVILRGGPRGLHAVGYRTSGRLVVAVTNDFGWVQITRPDAVVLEPNAAPPAARGVQVAWRRGHGLPGGGSPGPFEPPRAIDAVSGKSLAVDRLGDGHRVTLPPFRFMALLVVT